MSTTIFIARHNADSIEGRGPMLPVGYFTDYDAAVGALKGGGTMGGPEDPAFAVQKVEVYDTLVDWARNLPKDSRLKRWHEDVIADNDPEYKEYLRLKNKFETA